MDNSDNGRNEDDPIYWRIREFDRCPQDYLDIKQNEHGIRSPSTGDATNLTAFDKATLTDRG